MSALSLKDRQLWADQGFFRINGFVDPTVGQEMLDRVIELVRLAATGDDISPALVLPEQQPSIAKGGLPELEASKVFRVADAEPFRSFSTRDGVTAVAAELIGAGDIDCFLSQFIFKNPGAWGQPWHQDSYYFPFDPPRPVVGVWLAVTEATLENGCLHVLPGSHSEPIHEHMPDRRVGANYGYVEIVDHDMDGCEPVLMEPGDLLVFDSHLMHRSTDNVSPGLRAAMVFHFAAAGTVDRTEQLRGLHRQRLAAGPPEWQPGRRDRDFSGIFWLVRPVDVIGLTFRCPLQSDKVAIDDPEKPNGIDMRPRHSGPLGLCGSSRIVDVRRHNVNDLMVFSESPRGGIAPKVDGKELWSRRIVHAAIVGREPCHAGREPRRAARRRLRSGLVGNRGPSM